MVEDLIPAIWDEAYAMEAKDPLGPEQGAPKTKADPSHGNSKLAMICDVQQAWQYTADITHDERCAVLTRYGADLEYREAAYVLDADYTTVFRRGERGIVKLGLYLNGGKPWPEPVAA